MHSILLEFSPLCCVVCALVCMREREPERDREYYFYMSVYIVLGFKLSVLRKQFQFFFYRGKTAVIMLLIIYSLICIQDKEDDLKVGVKSTALRFGDSTKEWVGGFGIVCISSLALSGFNADIGKTCLLFHPHYFTYLQ